MADTTVPASPTPSPTTGTVAGTTPATNVPASTTTNVPSPTTLGGVTPSADVQLTEDDFKKDGDLRASAKREILENAPARGGSRSYNEVTDKTTVVTTVGGNTVTFEQDGDTRSDEERKSATDSAIRAFDRAEAARTSAEHSAPEKE